MLGLTLRSSGSGLEGSSSGIAGSAWLRPAGCAAATSSRLAGLRTCALRARLSPSWLAEQHGWWLLRGPPNKRCSGHARLGCSGTSHRLAGCPDLNRAGTGRQYGMALGGVVLVKYRSASQQEFLEEVDGSQATTARIEDRWPGVCYCITVCHDREFCMGLVGRQRRRLVEHLTIVYCDEIGSVGSYSHSLSGKR